MSKEISSPEGSPATQQVDEKQDIPTGLEAFVAEATGRAFYTAKLYQLRGKEHTKTARVLVDEYENYVPSTREIGQENGAGTYEIFVYWNNRQGKPQVATQRFILAERWNLIRDKFYAENSTQPAPAAAPVNSLQMLKDIVSVIGPLLQGKAGGSPADALSGLIEMQGKMLSSNMSTQLDMQNRMLSTLEESRRKMIDETEPGEKGNSDTINAIMEMLKTFVPLLLVAPQRQAVQVTRDTIARRPDMQAVVSSAAQMAQLEKRIDENFEGKTKEKILGVLREVKPKNGHAAAAPARTVITPRPVAAPAPAAAPASVVRPHRVVRVPARVR